MILGVSPVFFQVLLTAVMGDQLRKLVTKTRLPAASYERTCVGGGVMPRRRSAKCFADRHYRKWNTILLEWLAHCGSCATGTTACLLLLPALGRAHSVRWPLLHGVPIYDLHCINQLAFPHNRA
jgi:hypothetical protein